MKKRILLVLAVLLLGVSMVFAACGDPEDVKDPDGGKNPPAVTEGDVVTDLVIKTPPSKVSYAVGESFVPTGLVFDVTYENGYDGDKNFTGGDLDGWRPRTFSAGDTKVTITFDGFEKEIPITLAEREIESVEITRLPDISSYAVGSPLDLSGLMVRTEYADGHVETAATDYKVTDADGNVYEQGTILEEANESLTLTVSVTSGGATKSDTFTIGVYAGITVQVEDRTVSESASYVVQTGRANVKTDCTWTGTGYLGDVQVGCVLVFNIWSETAVSNAEIVLVASSTWQNVSDKTMRDMQFNKMFSVTKGDGDNAQAVEVADDVMITGLPFPPAGSSGNKWTNWTDVNLGSIDLVAGFNKVTISCIGTENDGNSDRTPNIDRLDIRF